MDTKQKAREIVEKEFRRNKRKNKNADYSSEEDDDGADTRRKRPMFTPSQVKTKDDKIADSKYRDRAQERREGTFHTDHAKDDTFDWNVDRRKQEPMWVPQKEDIAECAISRFETTEQAQEYLLKNSNSSTVLGRAIIRFWQTRWQKVNPNAHSKLSSSVYTMTTASHPPMQIMPSEKTYPLSTNKSSRSLLSDDVLQQIKRACSNAKDRCQASKVLIATSSKGPSNNRAGDDKDEDDDDDIFGDLGEYNYDQQDIEQQHAGTPTRKGEKVILFEPEEPEVAPVIILPAKAQSQRLEGFSPAMEEMDYPDDHSSGDEKKHKKKKRKKQRSGSDSE